MDMPCNCPECGDVVELDDMHKVGERFGFDVKMVCTDCYDKLEDESGEEHPCPECEELCRCDCNPCICCNPDW